MRLADSLRSSLRWLTPSLLIIGLGALACGKDGGGAPNPGIGGAPPEDAAVDVKPPDDASPPNDTGPDADAPEDSSTDHQVDGAPDFACDPVQQTRCAVGQKCDLTAGTFGCVADGTLDELARCEPEQPNGCKAGLSCRETGFGDQRCARLCATDAECRAAQGENCSSKKTTVDGKPYALCRALHQCNPLINDCAAGEACFLEKILTQCEPVKATPAPDGGECVVSADCNAGSTCIDIGPVNKCFAVCDVNGNPPSCGAGETCKRLLDIGPSTVGACGLP